MIGLLQRVSEAAVLINGEQTAAIEQGVLVFVGMRARDGKPDADRLLERILTYRMFADDQGKMNRSVQDVQGGVLLVPQFTLAADTRKGTRASFTAGAPAETARMLFQYLCQRTADAHPHTAFGTFGANMQVRLVNDGPVTFWLNT